MLCKADGLICPPAPPRLHAWAPPLAAVAVRVLFAALSLELTPTLAQQAPAPQEAGAPEPPATAGDRSRARGDEAETPDSTEQGQTPLTESFERRPLHELIEESKLEGIRDTRFNVQLRSMYLDSYNLNRSENQAWALGGSAGVKSGYFGGRIAFGATGYTSQRLEGPPDMDGTLLLRPVQRGYSVLGELYGEVLLTDAVRATAGRRVLETPFINTQDSRMTPNTFQEYAIQGLIGGRNDTPSLRFGAGYVDKIKTRDSEDFVSMATAAGAPAGVERGVYAAGALYKAGELYIGLVEYYSADIINIAYTEAKYAVPFADRVRLQFAVQYCDQRSTGEDLLTRHTFSTDQFGVKVELAMGPGLLTAARTGTATGANMRNPWGGYPGYASVQVENFDRAGEDATLLRAAYNFPRVVGLSAYGLWVHGSTPAAPKQYAQDEYDFDLQWKAWETRLKGLKLRARYAHVTQAGPGDKHQDDIRLILSYDLPRH